MRSRWAVVAVAVLAVAVVLVAVVVTGLLGGAKGGWEMVDGNTSVLREPSRWRPWVVAGIWTCGALLWLLAARAILRRRVAT